MIQECHAVVFVLWTTKTNNSNLKMSLKNSKTTMHRGHPKRDKGAGDTDPFLHMFSLFQKSFLSFVLSYSASLVLVVNGCTRVWICGRSGNLYIHLIIKHTCLKAYKARSGLACCWPLSKIKSCGESGYNSSSLLSG